MSLLWALERSRFANPFGVLAIETLLGASVKRAAAVLRIKWDDVWHVMEFAVKRGLSSKNGAIP